MMKSIKQMKTALMAGLFAGSFLCSAVAAAALSISDRPLFLGIQADPNIMFMLDDSGSMHWEFMPDELSIYADQPFSYPQPRNVYGAGDYASGRYCGLVRYFVPTFNPNSLNVIRFRSSYYNKMYYNPDITYEPWKNSDGSSMPDADPTNAYYNPAEPSLGGKNLTAQLTEDALWFEGSPNNFRWVPGISCGNLSHTYWPITYFVFQGGDDTNTANFTRVQITSATPSTDTFTSPGGITRTRDEEIQNFANWFTYYRSRLLASRGGIGAAFAEQGEDLRIGFGTINQGTTTVDGLNTRSIINGVRAFTGADRTSFFSLLYDRATPPANTPLRRALDDVGQYFTRTDNRGPWGGTPGTNDTTPHVQCRASYTILMTDGYWSPQDAYRASTADARDNNDNTNGPTHANPNTDNYVERRDGTDYNSYIVEDPFDDSHSNTLADVAMYYWKNDLRPDLQNKLAVKQQGDGDQDIANPAYWQHMTTFGVGLGVTGSQDADAAYQAVKDGTDITWPNPFNSSPAKIDDLLHASINSRGGFFSAADPDEFATELKNILNSIASDEASSSSAVANTTRLDTDTLVYQAKFSSDNWSGQLLAYETDDVGEIDVDNPKWDADDEFPASRKIFTYIPGNGAAAGGIDFEWAELSAAQKAALNTDIFGVVDGFGEERLNYLIGDVTETGPVANPFRSRVSEDEDDQDGYDILGDIVNSDPVFVGTGDFGYGRRSSGLDDAIKTKYAEFRGASSYQERTQMIYVGANDGMLHGFNARTGREEFAYVPNAVFSKLSALTSRDYTHDYYVDGSPNVGDAYIDGNWKTVLTSTLGAGGKAIFALDITKPGSMSSSNVMWETEADPTDADLKHMGVMLGKPTVVPTYSGRNGEGWIVLVGNGYNSTDHKAVLMVLSAEDGSVIKAIDTGVGSAAEPNGLATPLPVDLDGDRIVDYVYAGDLHGNLWKFDLTGNSNNWDVALASGGKPAPLFQACEGTGACTAATRQPITVQPTIASTEGGVIILFGTGKYFETGDETVGSSPRTESLYGIFDCAKCNKTVKKTELVQQEITNELDNNTANILDDDLRFSSNKDVDISSGDKGWYMDLITPSASNGAGERVVANPVLVFGRIIFVTFIPDSDPCNFGGSSWLMELNPTTGGAFDDPVLDINNDGVIDEDDLMMVDGKKRSATGKRSDEKLSAPGIVYGAGDDGTKILKILSGSSGNIAVEENKGDNKAGRQSWRELR